jgi:disulfide bond formation protein DsbB
MYKNLNFIKNIFHNHFELSVAVSSISIVLLAIVMDRIFFLQACPLCILTRYVFVLLALSALASMIIKKKVLGRLLIMVSSSLGLLVTSRQIYIQSMSLEDISQLSGCSMPFHTQVEYFGLIEAINKTLAGGPSCAEDGWRFLFNFAEWGFIFFLIYLVSTILKIRKS